MSGPQQVGGNQPLVGCFTPTKPVVPVKPVPVPAHQDQNHKKPADCVNPAPPEENHQKPGDCVLPGINTQGGSIFKNEGGSTNTNNMYNYGGNTNSPTVYNDKKPS